MLSTTDVNSLAESIPGGSSLLGICLYYRTCQSDLEHIGFSQRITRLTSSTVSFHHGFLSVNVENHFPVAELSSLDRLCTLLTIHMVNLFASP